MTRAAMFGIALLAATTPDSAGRVVLDDSSAVNVVIVAGCSKYFAPPNPPMISCVRHIQAMVDRDENTHNPALPPAIRAALDKQPIPPMPKLSAEQTGVPGGNGLTNIRPAD